MLANTFFRNLLDVPKNVPIIKDMYFQDHPPSKTGEKGGYVRILNLRRARYSTKYKKGNLRITVGVQFYIRIDALFRQYRKKDHTKLEQFLKFFFLEKLDKNDPIGSFDKFLTEEMKEFIFTDYAERAVL